MSSGSTLGFSYIDNNYTDGSFKMRCNICKNLAKRCKKCLNASCKNKHLVAVTSGVEKEYKYCDECKSETTVRELNKEITFVGCCCWC